MLETVLTEVRFATEPERIAGETSEWHGRETDRD